MSTSTPKGIATAILMAGLVFGSASIALADQPAVATPVAQAPAAKADNPTDNALRRNPPTSGIGVRGADRAHCREQAAKLKLFGLGRHKFLQRCRKARRKAAQQPQPPR